MFPSHNQLDALVAKVIAGVPVEKLTFAIDAFKGVTPMNQTDESRLRDIERMLRNSFGNEKCDRLIAMANDVVSSLSTLLEKMTGIGYWVDKEIETDKIVFSVVGPHMGDYGGAQVALVFNPSILWHPDTFLTPCAAIAYHQGWYCAQDDMKLDRRAWMGNARPWQEGGGGRDDYNAAKFHPIAKRWSSACALEWIARASGYLKKPLNEITLVDVQMMWKTINSHTAIEGHLPAMIPLDYVDKILIDNKIPKSVSGLSTEAMQNLDMIFSEKSLQMTKHGDASVVEYVPDVRERLFEIMTTGSKKKYPPWQIPRGFCFVIKPGWKEHICPLFVTLEQGPVFLNFVVVKNGNDFAASLIDSQKIAVTIRMVNIDDAVSFGTMPPGSPRQSTFYEHFSIDTPRPVTEYILIVGHEGKMILTHSGPSSFVNKKCFVTNMPKSTTGKWFLSLSTEKSIATVRWISHQIFFSLLNHFQKDMESEQDRTETHRLYLFISWRSSSNNICTACL